MRFVQEANTGMDVTLVPFKGLANDYASSFFKEYYSGLSSLFPTTSANHVFPVWVSKQ